MKKNVWKNLELKTAGILLAVVTLLSVSLFYVFYNQYYGLIVTGLQDDAITVHKYVEENLSADSFIVLNTREDEESELYITTRNQLNEIRRVTNILYLYTAKRSESGQYIYIVDGLHEDDISDSGYFCHIGDLIEDDIIPRLEQSLRGETVLGDEILSTEWGIVYAAFFPFHDIDGNIIGAIGMEFDCEHLYEAMTQARLFSFLIAFTISITFVLFAYIMVRRIVKNAETAYRDVEKEKNETEEKMRAIMDASPMASHYWTREGKIIDCNEASLALFGYKSKQEYISKWLSHSQPEYQPDGQRSDMKGLALLEKAFEEGKCVFDWVHIANDQTLIPVEVTMVRVEFGDDCFVAGYSRDLRVEKELEAKADVKYDKLTGLFTKQYMEERMTRTLRILSRAGGELSLMIVSIDFLRPYYETYGVASGEKCVKTVTEVLKSAARRADDLIARHRNEDFIVVLPNTNKIGAVKIAEKLIEVIHEQNIPHTGNAIAPHVTFSIGITTGKVFHRQRVNDYMNRAEEMLYIAKQSGRNRYSYADL